MKKPKKTITQQRVAILGIAFLVTLATGVAVAMVALRPHQPSAVKLAVRPLLRVGQIAQAGDFSLRIDSFREDAVGDQAFVPGIGMRYVIPHLSIRNNGKSAGYIAPVAQAFLRDNQGVIYHMSPATTNTPLVAGILLPGKNISGEISFDVPATARGLNLYYQIGNYQPAVISLGR